MFTIQTMLNKLTDRFDFKPKNKSIKKQGSLAAP